MNASHVSDELLQRHFDGELEPAEQVETRKHLADCDSCTARLRSLGRLQSLIRMAAEDAASDADFRDMFARIERAASTPEREVAAPNARERARSKWFRPATVSARGGLAVAAAVLLMIYRQDADTTATLPDDSSGALAVLENPRSEIVHVDFGQNAGTVFEIAMADGSSTPVVWINDEDLGE